MDYVRYSRAVIVLEEKDREFADKPGTEMKGYLRVETGNGRGAFRCVIHNVKYCPRSEYTYQLILFGKRKERTIHTVVGTIPVSRFGTGEVYLRFHPNDVDGRGNDYCYYTTAIVAAVSSKNRTESLHPVLIGTTGDIRKEEVSKPLRSTYNQYYAEYLKHVCQYFWSDVREEALVEPFGRDAEGEEELVGARWLQIEDPSAMFLVSPGAKYFAERYGHFLLGRDGGMENVTYLVAVPGRNSLQDQPDGGESGFQLWKGCGEDGWGYWILKIDGTTGEIFSVKPL